MEGWIKLHRKLSDNPLWTCEPFTRGQAWVDLVLLANHEYGFFYKRGVKIEVNRGQVGISEIGLSDRWKWSRTKVRKFIKDLEKEQQIVQQKNNVTQTLTIVNYDLYQSKEQQKIQQKDSKRTTEEQQKDTNKNNKNVKNDNKYIYEWMSDFEIYKTDCRKAFIELRKDKEYIDKLQKFYPGVNIFVSMEKVFTDYLATNDGWNKKKEAAKKSLKTKDEYNIDWKQTISNLLKFHKVYFTKEELAKINS